MSIKAKALWLSDYYQQVADGGQVQLRHTVFGWEDTECYPNMCSDRSSWRIKPTPQIIDMSVCIDGIDVELWNGEYKTKIIATLTNVNSGVFQPADKTCYRYCRPRMSPHIHYCAGMDYPLPDGLNIKAYFLDDRSVIDFVAFITSKSSWAYYSMAKDIIGFEVLGLDEGWEWAE